MNKNCITIHWQSLERNQRNLNLHRSEACASCFCNIMWISSLILRVTTSSDGLNARQLSTVYDWRTWDTTNSSEMQPLTNGRVLTSAKSMYQHKVGARPLGKILQENAPPPSSRSFMLRHPWSLLPPKQYLNVFPTFYCSVPFNILVGVVYLHRVQRRNNGVSILTMCTKS